MFFNYTIKYVEGEKICFKLSNGIEYVLNVALEYPQYCLKIGENGKDLYWDNTNKEIVKIDTNRVVVTCDNIVFTPATQFQIDKSEEQYNSDNWKVYCHLKKVFDETVYDY